MRVLHINSNYDRTTLHQAMMDQLDELCSNAVFVPTHDRNCGVVELGDNVLVSECFRKNDRLFFSYKQRKILKAVQSCFDVASFELLHAYTLFTDGNVAYELHKKYHIPYVVAVRNTDVNAFFKYRPHLRGRGIEILRNAAAVFFLSESYRAQVMDRYVPEKDRARLLEKVHIIPNGIDEYWFGRGAAHRKPEGKGIRLVFAGSIDRNKNVTTTAKACKLLRDRGYDATLTIIGKLVEPKIKEELGNLPYVRFLPRMRKEELAETYLAQDIFVMPSYHESFGLVYAEAMSQGLPVVYSQGQGFDGQFPEGTVGYHVKSDDSQQILQAVEEILREYEAISNRCISSCQAFHWNSLVRSYHEIYRGCLK